LPLRVVQAIVKTTQGLGVECQRVGIHVTVLPISFPLEPALDVVPGPLRRPSIVDALMRTLREESLLEAPCRRLVLLEWVNRLLFAQRVLRGQWAVLFLGGVKLLASEREVLSAPLRVGVLTD